MGSSRKMNTTLSVQEDLLELRSFKLKLNYTIFPFLLLLLFSNCKWIKTQASCNFSKPFCSALLGDTVWLCTYCQGTLRVSRIAFLPEPFLNYCHQNSTSAASSAGERHKAHPGLLPTSAEMHLEKLFVEQTSVHLHFFYSQPFSIYAS